MNKKANAVRFQEFSRYSRAGDAFHYRWAARRCLRLLEVNSSLRCVIVESSARKGVPGEYVIDVAEYWGPEGQEENVAYFQLKHSTTRINQSLTWSELKKTIAGFAERFRNPPNGKSNRQPRGLTSFSLVTNRKVGAIIKKGVTAIASGSAAAPQVQRNLEKSTRLKGQDLRRFCTALSFIDGEGDYVVQKRKLGQEAAECVAGLADSPEIEKLITLVADRALPESNGVIVVEDVLQRFNISSKRALFPAPPKFESLSHLIKREQHDELLDFVLRDPKPTIVHAAGGVGKSVVACQLAESLPKGSRGIVYDCFGGGNYRNESEPRHRACDAFVQIANQLASFGLSRTLISIPGVSRDILFRSFLERIKEAIGSLREQNAGALLLLIIDAADNAGMAAADVGDLSFIPGLLKEPLPDGCLLTAFCRTERIDLLKPPSFVRRYRLKPFSIAETSAHLRARYPTATSPDCLEFHRLSGGNPRIQANSLAAQPSTVEAILSKLGPGGTSVDKQIEAQLESAIASLKDKHPTTRQSEIDLICQALSNLPPFIPIEVLASASGVGIPTIDSFVNDLGRPLWKSDDAVQFRDEPTETWFRSRFSADASQVATFAKSIEPLAAKHTYVAKALPQLLLRSGSYNELIALALTDDLLPEQNPIDARSIRSYRLQFAFQAALRLGKFGSSAKLAMRAGEEIAGTNRQMELLERNIDLLPQFLTPHRIQEIAYKQNLKSGWPGSENAYSAALLSGVNDFKGEARGYLRAAERWLQIYFEQQKKRKSEATDDETGSYHHQALKDADISELMWAHYNIFGPVAAVKYIGRWRPAEAVFRVVKLFVRRLVDAGQFDEINRFVLTGSRSVVVVLAATEELVRVAKLPPRDCLSYSLKWLSGNSKTREKQELRDRKFAFAIVSFVEAAAALGLSRKRLCLILNFYTERRAERWIAGDSHSEERHIFIRAISIRAVLEAQVTPDIEGLFPEDKSETKKWGNEESQKKNFVQVMGALFPWYIVRAKCLIGDSSAENLDLEAVRKASKEALSGRYHQHDPVRFEINRARFAMLAVRVNATQSELDEFDKFVIKRSDWRFGMHDRIDATRIAFRSEHLSALRVPLEQLCASTIESATDEGPLARAEYFVSLARAILPVSQADAEAYFSFGVDALSKFGDEMVERWIAIVALADRASQAGSSIPELTYRFVRCGEVVGETVAREKYWDRDGVFRTAARLHPPSAFAALSRWRDRGVGWFGDQLLALAMETVTNGTISPTLGWCLTGFIGCNGSGDFAAACIRRATDNGIRQSILKSATRDLELASAPLEAFEVVEQAASQLNLDRGLIRRLIDERLHHSIPEEEKAPKPCEWEPTPASLETGNGANFKLLIRRVEVTTREGISKAIRSLRESDCPLSNEDFFQALMDLVPAGKEKDFMEAVTVAEGIDSYQLGAIITKIQLRWLNKVSVKRAWIPFLRAVGSTLANEISNHDALRYWQYVHQLDAASVNALTDGIIQGLADSLELPDASTYFGFVTEVAKRITPAEALEILEYSISRFETHVDVKASDGPWHEWLRPPEDVTEAVSGLLWSALGSPESSMRWQACHCVRRLGEFSQQHVIDSLVRRMNAGTVGQFGSVRYPFYGLHAKLYLLTALSRIAKDGVESLLPHSELFADIALRGFPHILIQKTASDIARSIEQGKAGTYSKEELQNLRNVGRSILPTRREDRIGTKLDTPWHLRGEVDKDLKVYFGMDFERYWFAALAGVFGIVEDQAAELGRLVAVKNLNAINGEDYHPDPRREQWQLSGDGGGTWHDHGSYPRVHDHTFYQAYHSLMSVAAQLLAAMPVIQELRYDSREDRWSEWLEGHWFVRTDGRWLADRRDPCPTKRRNWVTKGFESDWIWKVNADDFFDVICSQCSRPGFVCISGEWTEFSQDRVEELSVNSAFVDSRTGQALAEALRSCSDPYSFRLPAYLESEAEVDMKPFELKGWVRRRGGCGDHFDSFDPYAKQIDYPPDRIGENFLEKLGLEVDLEQREWRLNGATDSCGYAEVWSERASSKGNDPCRVGSRLSASVTFLKDVCSKLKMDLIWEVQIKRRRAAPYGSRDSEEHIYYPPWHKIFVLSHDGILRDGQKNHKLG